MRTADQWIAGVLLVLLMAASLLAMLGGGQRPQDAMLPIRSSHSAAPAGTKALYLGLRGMDYDVQRWTQPLDALQGGDALFVVTSYSAVPFHTREWEALRSWLRPGRVLVLAFEGMHTAPESQQLTVSSQGKPAFGPPEVAMQVIAPALATGITNAARDVAIAGSHRLDPEPSAQLMAEEGDTAPAARSGSAAKPADKTPPSALEALIASGVPLYSERGPVVSLGRVNGGTVLLVATPWTLSNDGIARSGNFRLVTALLQSRLRGKSILFDEYHHGYGARRGVLALISPAGRAALGHLAVGLLLLLVTSAWRLGRPVKLPQPARERTEYITSMAAVLRSAGAAELAARRLGGHYQKWIARSLKAPATDAALLVALAAQRSSELGTQVDEALRRGAALIADPRAARGGLLHWAQSTTRLCERLERLDHADR